MAIGAFSTTSSVDLTSAPFSRHREAGVSDVLPWSEPWVVKSFLASAGSRISRSIDLTNRSVGRPCSTKGNTITKKRLAKGPKE